MGNTVVWKPSTDPDRVAAYLTMQLLEAAGLPAGRDQPACTGDGLAVSEVVLPTRGWPASTSPGRRPPSSTCGARSAPTSTATTAIRGWSARPAARTSWSRTPRRDPDVLRTALIRGAFDYQGQKCSAASRAFIAALGVAPQMGDDFLEPGRGAALRRRHRPDQLRRRADRRARLRRERRRPSNGPRARRSVTIAAGGDIRRQRRLFRRVRPCCCPTTRPTRRSAPSTSARSCPCTSTTTTPIRREILDVVDTGSRRTR